MHVKVHVGANITSNTSGTFSDGHVSHTGQLFFDDTLSDSVGLLPPYSSHKVVRTRNSEDEIYGLANGSVTLVSIIPNSANNFTGMVTLGVNSSAIPALLGYTLGNGTGPGNSSKPPGPNNSSTSTIHSTAVDIRKGAIIFLVPFIYMYCVHF